jgi:hypothetical protein
MKMRSSAWVAVSLGLAVTSSGLAVLGCGATSPPVSTAQSATTRAPVSSGAHGRIRLLCDALGDVPLTAVQRAEVEKLAADAAGRQAAARTARKELEVAVADQVEVGRLDRAGLSPKVDALAAALQRAQPADRAAFERLHSILGPDQRTAFANAVEAHAHEMWHPLLRMKEWADLLKLTDDQRAQIKAALKQRMEAARASDHAGEGGRRGAKALNAFKDEHFVFDQVAPAEDYARRTAGVSARFLDTAAQVLPLLTPPQRSVAAQKLRSHSDSLGLEP